LPLGPHQIEVRPKGNGPVLLFGVALDRDGSGVVMDTLGINGAREAYQLAWDPRLFADHLTRRDPDLVVLSYGTNAVGDDDDPIQDFEARLDLVVNRVRSLVPDASCLYIGPSDRPIRVRIEDPDPTVKPKRRGKPPTKFVFYPRSRQAQVIDAQRRVAHRYGCGYWDWEHAMGGSLSMVQWANAEPKLGTSDYVHLTRAGYQRVADLFWDALMSGYAPEVAGTPGAQ
jgi:lysophospholipase L1-like esterase